eukprot:Phypoly_transcript_03395.p1 GENE.Phypoly_transcript_03395~~Phypoly_transcript_03395.p1  ORF type:complete len:819 (+),score=48.98 Phypoly_transcript_03395:115-2457(+)
MDKNDQSFLVSFVVNVFLFIVFLVLFLIFRKRVPKVYQPRCDGSPNAPHPPPPSMFGWVRSTVQYGDEQLFQTHGMDAMMFIKFVRMMLCIAALISIYGFVVLFPVNATAFHARSSNSTDSLHVSGLDTLTMSAVKERSNRMVAQLFSVVINSTIVFFFTFKLYRTYLKYRLRMRTESMRIENYSVMVRGVPELLSDKNLHSFFSELFPGKVVHVIRSHLTPELDSKLKQRDKEMKAVEKAFAKHLISGKRPTNKDKFLIGKVVDSLNWHTERFNSATFEAGALQKVESPRANVVFVVFNDLSAASQCSTAILDTRNRLVPEPAPEPRDLVWTHFNIGDRQFLIRTLIADVFFFFLIFFWIIPVTFVSGLSNLKSLEKLKAFNWLTHFIELSPVVTGFVQGFLPTLAMIIFFALLVKIITAVVTLTGLYSKSEISRGVMTKYYLFQIFNVLLVYSIAGAVINVLHQIVDNPGSIVNLLANSLPQQSGFFVNYVMLLSLSGHSKSLWRPAPLIVRWIKHKFLSKTAREYRDAEAPGSFSYAQTYTTHLLVFTVLLVYSTIAPFIMIWGVLYFCLGYISNKYNIIYVYIPIWEGGGKHWEEVFHRIYAALILYQVVLAGVFGIFKFIPGVVVSAVCIVASVVVMVYIKDEFAKSCQHLPLRIALERSDFFTELNTPSEKGTLVVPNKEMTAISLDETADKRHRGWQDLEEASSNNNTATDYTSPPHNYFQPSLQPITSHPELVIAPHKIAKIQASALSPSSSSSPINNVSNSDAHSEGEGEA